MIDVVRMLERRCNGRSQRDVAAELGVSEQYLSDVLRGRTDPGPMILEGLGVERVVTYRRRKGSHNGSET